MKSKNSLGTINDTVLILGWNNLCNIVGEVKTPNVFLRGVILPNRFSPGNYPRRIQPGYWDRVSKISGAHPIGLVPLHWQCIFMWTRGEEKIASFLNLFNNCHSNIKFIHDSNKEHILVLDLNMRLSGNKLFTDLHIESLYFFKPRTYEQIYCLQPSSENMSYLILLLVW